MENKKAFPESCTDQGYKSNVDNGMDLLDYFAAKAMQGIIVSDQFGMITNEKLATISYNIASEMIKVRETYKTK